MVLYLLAIGLPKLELIGTGAWYSCWSMRSRCPSAYTWLDHASSLLVDAWLVLPMLPGALLGPWILRRLNQRGFEAMALT